MSAVVEDIDFQHDESVPESLVAHARNKRRLRELLVQERATAVRLVRLPGLWSNPTIEVHEVEAFEVQVLGRPGKGDDTALGPWGMIFVDLSGAGEWALLCKLASDDQEHT